RARAAGAAGRSRGLHRGGVVRPRERHAVRLDLARVAQRRERLPAEDRDEQALDERLARLAAGAVGPPDLGVAAPAAPAADVLDQAEDLELPVGDGLVGHHTT